MTKAAIEKAINDFVRTTNTFDVEAALQLFATNAVIDDVSVGRKFKNTAGVRNYLETFFVGYHTATKIESITIESSRKVVVQVDFTGDFGHETGALEMLFNADGLIQSIDAHLD